MMKKTNLLILLVYCIIFVNCTNQDELIRSIIDSKDTISVGADCSLQYKSDEYILNYEIQNLGSDNIYLAMSDFLIDHSQGPQATLLTDPINTYSLNTIYIIEVSNYIHGLMILNSMFEIENIPMYVKLKPKSKFDLILTFHKVMDVDSNFHPRFQKKIQYKVINRLSILSESKFKAFYNSIDFLSEAKYFTTEADDIHLNSESQKKVIRMNGAYSNVKIDSTKSYWINLLSNSKTEIIDTIGSIY